MRLHNDRLRCVSFAFLLLILLVACINPTTSPETATPVPTEPAVDTPETATPTPTPTTVVQQVIPTSTPIPSRCEGLAGQLEVQVLVGPADAVGLEPVAVGSVPFAVTGSESPHLVQGQGPISYEAVLQEKWGTYTVIMEMDVVVQGDCSGQAGSEQLDLMLEMTGEQLVEVEAEGFHGEYPWSGTQTRDLTFSLEEGATASGEGWVIVLHLSGP